MLFENKTKKSVKARVVENKKQNKYGWRTVKPGKKIKLEQGYGLRLNLTPVENEESKTPEEPDNPEDETDNRTDEQKEHDDWKEEVLAVNGVGVKTAEDILAKYPTRESIIKAVKANEHLPMKDDVADHFIKKYDTVDADEGNN